jgi:hypothetical protein
MDPKPTYTHESFTDDMTLSSLTPASTVSLATDNQPVIVEPVHDESGTPATGPWPDTTLPCPPHSTCSPRSPAWAGVKRDAPSDGGAAQFVVVEAAEAGRAVTGMGCDWGAVGSSNERKSAGRSEELKVLQEIREWQEELLGSLFWSTIAVTVFMFLILLELIKIRKIRMREL